MLTLHVHGSHVSQRCFCGTQNTEWKKFCTGGWRGARKFFSGDLAAGALPHIWCIGLQSRLGITQATLERRRLMQEEYDSLERLIDTDGNKLLDPSEIRRACQKDPTIQGRMEVLAFNLALDPEYR